VVFYIQKAAGVYSPAALVLHQFIKDFGRSSFCFFFFSREKKKKIGRSAFL